MLPVETTFHADELLVSYAWRLAAANGLSSMQDLLRDFQINTPAFLTAASEALTAFSQYTNGDLQSARWRSFSVAPENYILLAGQTLERTRLLRGNFRVCLGCLRDDVGEVLDIRKAVNAYARIVWYRRSARVCPIHGLLLVLPPEEGPLHDFWGTWSPWMTDVFDGDLDRRVDGRFEKYAMGVFLGKADPIGWADQFDPGTLGMASEMLGRANNVPYRQTGRRFRPGPCDRRGPYPDGWRAGSSEAALMELEFPRFCGHKSAFIGRCPHA